MLHFVDNLTADICWSFYDNDVTAVKSIVLRTQPLRVALFLDSLLSGIANEN